MEKTKKIIATILGGVIITTLALGSMAFISYVNVKASDEGTEPQGFDPQGGKGGPRGNHADEQKYLVEALGITEDELDAAQQEATAAAIQAAIDQGLITQEQADEMLSSDKGFRWFGFGGRGRPGESQTENTIDYDAYLAEALGITLDDLKAAREQARELMQAAAVENGDITQEQLDLMEVNQALRDYINPRALQVEALGISEEELKVYREAGTSWEDILAAVGMAEESYQEAYQAAYEAAIAKAVSDGVITQEQADLYLANLEKGMPGMGGMHRGGMGQPPDQNSADQNASGAPPAHSRGGGPGGPGGFGRPGGEGNPYPVPTEAPES
ncbi:MAG: hypothetical protein JW908_16585 [Anaerolineales bacterium]|nr:hypothetical protein [Anaerolineales bacterium]